MHYFLIYELSDDYLEKRGEFRNEHLQLAWDAHNRGDLVTGGALQDPSDKAYLLFKGDNENAVKHFAETDPYVKNGLVKNWTIRPWMTVVGDIAENPVKPGS
jgi:uncharacterized protein YciI